MNKLLQRLDRFWNDQTSIASNRAGFTFSLKGRAQSLRVRPLLFSRHVVAALRPAGGAQTRIGHIAVTATLGCGRCAITSMWRRSVARLACRGGSCSREREAI